MPRVRSRSSRAAGKLISEIQKVWGDALGTDDADAAEDVMGRAHDLLRLSDSRESLLQLLEGRSCAAYLGDAWVRRHPVIRPSLEAFERAALENDTFPPSIS